MSLDKFDTIYKLEIPRDGINGVIEIPEDLKKMLDEGYLIDKQEVVDGNRLVIVFYFDRS